jgi:polyhydroxyalkanoate synthesis repressor PhaR
MALQGAHGPRLVRRYGNRKLYDTRTRRYVTVAGLGRLVAAGHEVEVVDQESGEDLTAVVLAQVILEGVRARTARVPRQILAAVIRLGAGAATGAAEWAPAQAAVRAGHEAERIARRVVDHLTLDEAAALRREIAEALQKGAAEAQRGMQARVGALLQQWEKQAAGHPVLATLGAWLAGATGAARRRTSWRKSTGTRPPGKRHAPAGPRAKPRRPAGRRRPRSSATAGRPRPAR